MRTNVDRAARISDDVLPLYEEDSHTNAVDLLADLMHWCKAEGVDFQKMLNTATMHFNEEQE